MINQKLYNQRKITFKIPKISSLILYFFTFLILLLDMTDNFPGTSTLRKAKYVLILLMAIDYFASGKIKIKVDDIIIFGGLFLHTILFGLIFVNDTVADDTYTHCQQMLIYLAFLFLTVNIVRKYNCRLQFIELTSWAFAIFLIWTGVTHFSSFVNPIYWINALSSSERYRGGFGTSSPNYIGYICLISLIFMFLLLQEYRKNRELSTLRIVVWGAMLLWAFSILMSSGSRSSILSLIIIVAFGIINYFYKRNKKMTAFVGTMLAVVVLIFLILNWSSIWDDSNRDSNISVNYEVFNYIGNWWTGMGYVESSGFLSNIYGYDTFAMDIYYVYIFFTTGIIGSVLIGIVLLYILFSLFKRKDIPNRFYLIAVFIVLLFDGMWQVNILTYRYAPTLCIYALIIVSLGQGGNKGKKIKPINRILWK